MNELELTFYELFYGSGKWLGILLLLSIVITLIIKSRYASILVLPVTIFMGIDYLSIPNPSQSNLWCAIIMFFASIGIIINLIKEKVS